MIKAPGLLRARDAAGSEVTNLELVFDLVYVLAVTQIAHLLVEHLDWHGALRAAMILLAVWWAWIFTTWAANWLDPRRLPVTIALIAIMFGSLVMSASIPDSFEHRAAGFAGSYVAIHVLLATFVIWALRSSAPFRRRNFERILVWSTLSGVVWIAGIFAEGTTRELIWLAALAIHYAAPAAGFWVPGWGKSTTTDWDVSGAHMAERCQLFIIIALGESIVAIGRTFADHAIDWETCLAVATAFGGAITLWWLYFSHMATIAEHAISSSNDPGRAARSAYTYSHGVMVAGIVCSAVGDELVIEDPGGHTATATALVVIGGVVLFLVGYVMFEMSITGQVSWPLPVAIALLALLIGLRGALTPQALGLLTLGVAVALAASLVPIHRRRLSQHHSRATGVRVEGKA